MFENLAQYPIESPQLGWESKVVIREINEGPRLYIRLRLTGTQFPLFDTIPFVRVGRAITDHVAISDDGLTADAYFENALSEDGVIEFGYDNQPLLRFPHRYSGGMVQRLDERRLPEALRYQERLFRPEIG